MPDTDLKKFLVNIPKHYKHMHIGTRYTYAYCLEHGTE